MTYACETCNKEEGDNGRDQELSRYSKETGL